ncbi:cofactor-independent phosphoglycerate mutase [Geomonas sp. Red69]|uniref:Cofactor-independent phosphoglycerate mutase n=1 Tax=Geomonas diazotrophica TaxID=2843197 RepID=A0ABX8JBR4_9BACT|nr:MULTISPECIES: cofactor-independent phosphoglycerate mutase [Geomonas]MBU5637372.1 cofactor-independent phosphoglycerate mutase [Geomonas diazotrophica]QWV95810.1 cofactor-independent phosphoglycerate mutase [Geomonas nitrogeniifigens]QXE84882.1 cofactor-independent phosphoglycerate mutase [Geomonas nitrogeniifigens]
MKYVVLLGDGMSDQPVGALEGKTPLQAAKTPNMDFMAKRGTLGLAHTVPEGYAPGSDVANLSMFGYNPVDCYTGRSPLEAASMGVSLGPDDVAFRLNLVHLEARGGKLIMEDYSAGHISSADGRELVEELQRQLGNEEFSFHPGVSYRHLMVWHGGRTQIKMTPPHDISGQDITSHMPSGEGADKLIYLMNSSQMIFHNHPQYKRRAVNGEVPANSIWLWGHGKAPAMEGFGARYGLTGAVISAVDLIKGIGVYAGLDIINVPGATGYLDTNFEGKAQAAIDALKEHDFVFVHVEAPDEASHSGKLADKIKAIELFDEKVVGPVLQGVKQFGEYRILCAPDHPTPITLMTHSSDPVPFVIYSGEEKENAGVAGYDEIAAAATGLKVAPGYKLMEMLLGR